MTIPIIPLLVAVIGVSVYSLADGKASEAGRIAYFAGLLVLLLGLARWGVIATG